MKKMLYNYTNHTIINFLFGRKFMADLKNSWKNTGAGLGHAFRDLGKTIIVSGKEGVDKAVDWAESDPNANTAQQGYVPQGAPYVPQGAPIHYILKGVFL